MRVLTFILVLMLFIACADDDVNPYFAEVYPQILDEIDIECTESSHEYYISAKINGLEFCHDPDKVGDFVFAVSNKFTTSSPNFSTGQVYDDARHGMILMLGTIGGRNEHFVIQFPDFDLERDAQLHLDSLIAIGTHRVMGEEDVIIPEGSSYEDELILKSTGGFLQNFLIVISSTDSEPGVSGGNTFTISSIFGNQCGSYFRFNEVKKTTELDGTYYYMDIDFECNLYHAPKYGYEGLWGEVRDGKIIVKLRLLE